MSKIISKLKSMPQGAKASIAFFFASLITKGIAYLVTPVYTRILTPEQYGQTSLFLTWLEIFGIISMFCLSYGVFNNGMIDFKEKRDEFSFSMLALSNVITIGFTLIILAIYPIIQDVIGIDLALLLLMCAIFLVQPAYNFWTARQRYELKYKKTVIVTIVSALLSPTVAIICILSTETQKLYARLFGAELVLIIIYIIFYFILAKKSGFKINTKYWKRAILFNLPLIPHYLSTYLLGNSNKLLITYIIGDEANAFYSVAYSVAAIGIIVWSAVNSSLIPYTYENCKEKNYSNINKVTMPILTAFAVVCVLVMMFAPEVVAIMATAEYMEAIYVIPPIVGGVFFQVQYYMYANVVYYYKKPKFVMIASVSAVILNLILGYFCILTFGYLAAGYVTLACYLLQATLDYFAMRLVVKEKIYNMKYVGLLALAVILIAVFSNLLYGLVVVRYLIVGIILVLTVVFRKKLIKLIRFSNQPKPNDKED